MLSPVGVRPGQNLAHPLQGQLTCNHVVGQEDQILSTWPGWQYAVIWDVAHSGAKVSLA